MLPDSIEAIKHAMELMDKQRADKRSFYREQEALKVGWCPFGSKAHVEWLERLKQPEAHTIKLTNGERIVPNYWSTDQRAELKREV